MSIIQFDLSRRRSVKKTGQNPKQHRLPIASPIDPYRATAAWAAMAAVSAPAACLGLMAGLCMAIATTVGIVIVVGQHVSGCTDERGDPMIPAPWRRQR